LDRFNLGEHSKAITTSSDDAQRYFDLGLNWCYAFNQEEAVACFRKALEHDPECAMAHWGVAYAAGPFYNYTWRDLSDREAIDKTRLCFDHVKIARSLSQQLEQPARANTLSPTSVALEQALIEALNLRFQSPNPVSMAEFDAWDDAYANAMRLVYQSYKNDHEVMALFAESLMMRTPWKLWDVKRGVPPSGADTYEALGVIERSITMNTLAGTEQHPAILHLHIHATEMSLQPEQALSSAKQLGPLCPDGGHLQHMPGHTYFLCGQYENAKRASIKAIKADEKYLEYAGPFNFYTTARCHNLHLMMYSCMFLGQFKPAWNAVLTMRRTLSKEVLSMPDQPQMTVTMEGYYSMGIHVLVRFGRWQDIIKEAEPDDASLYCVTVAMLHYAKGVAYAALKQAAKAQAQYTALLKAIQNIPAERYFFNNPALDILAVGSSMLRGEMAYHEGRFDDAFHHLRESVSLSDALHYSEPWPWMHPPRHALGALLAEQGHFDEAGDVFRTDLGLNNNLHRCAQHPDNVWALLGLVECLRQRGDAHELREFETKLAIAMAKTDIPISSACLCRAAP